MKMTNFTFALLISLFFSVAGIAQKEKSTTKFAEESEADRFAYSYGILLGDNLKTIGLTADLMDFNKLYDGIKAFLKAEKGAISENAAQQVIADKLNELTKYKEDQAAGKKTSTLTKASLEEFIYNYGIVIAINWKNFDLKLEDIAVTVFEQAIKDVLAGAESKITNEEAQQEVNKRFQAMLQERTNQQLVENKAFMEKNKSNPKVVSLPSGIQYEILTKGTGKQATSESTVVTHYHGTLINGTVFDSSVERNEPISFKLSGVIKGWQEIIPMMKEKGKWRIFVPPHLAYGNRERGKIPANAMLIFEIELLEVQ